MGRWFGLALLPLCRVYWLFTSAGPVSLNTQVIQTPSNLISLVTPSSFGLLWTVFGMCLPSWHTDPSCGCPLLRLALLPHVGSGDSLLLQFSLHILTSALSVLQLHRKPWLKCSQFPLCSFCKFKKYLMFAYQKLGDFFFAEKQMRKKTKRGKQMSRGKAIS